MKTKKTYVRALREMKATVEMFQLGFISAERDSKIKHERVSIGLNEGTEMNCKQCGCEFLNERQTGVFWVELAVTSATAFREKRQLRINEIADALKAALEY
jgi:hypothetical protein